MSRQGEGALIVSSIQTGEDAEEEEEEADVTRKLHALNKYVNNVTARRRGEEEGGRRRW